MGEYRLLRLDAAKQGSSEMLCFVNFSCAVFAFVLSHVAGQIAPRLQCLQCFGFGRVFCFVFDSGAAVLTAISLSRSRLGMSLL